MAGTLRLNNTGTGNGQSTITTAATGDATYTLPSVGGTFLTTSGNVTFQFASGTVGAPSVTFVDDLDTGLYSPGANQVAIATSGTERLSFGANGVVTVKNGAVAEIGVLADGATITPDFAANCNFTATISGNRTLANPSNITAGQTGSIFIIQGTGSNTLSWGSYWDFPGGTAPTLSTTSGAVDRVDYVVRSSTSIHTVFTANYS